MIPVYVDELADILRACTRLRPDECSLDDLRRQMADHLARTNPGLAGRVLAFDGPQMVAIRAFALQAQALVGMTAGRRPSAVRAGK